MVGQRILPGLIQIYQVILSPVITDRITPFQSIIEKTGLEAIGKELHLALFGFPPYSQVEQTLRKKQSKTEGEGGRRNQKAKGIIIRIIPNPYFLCSRNILIIVLIALFTPPPKLSPLQKQLFSLE